MQHSLLKPRIGDFLFAFTLLILVMLVALRTSGLDYQSYLQEYNDPSIAVSGELGYRALIVFLGKIAPFSVLLVIANLIFFISHAAVWKEARNGVAIICIFAYLFYIGTFLLMGSPRRLIAYSFVVPIIVMTVRESGSKTNFWVRILLAATFHTSALIAVAYFAAGKNFKELKAGITWKRTILFFAGLLCAVFVIFYSGLYNFIFEKIYYYVVYAGEEQDYLGEVPSVFSGMAKRAIVLSFLLFGAWRHSGKATRIGFRLIAMEAVFYTAGSLISPVIAVISSYFVIGYLLVALEVANSRSTYLRKCSALVGCMFFFLPTAIGLIKLFPNAFGL